MKTTGTLSQEQNDCRTLIPRLALFARFSQGDRPSVAGSYLTRAISRNNQLASHEKILTVKTIHSFILCIEISRYTVHSVTLLIPIFWGDIR